MFPAVLFLVTSVLVDRLHAQDASASQSAPKLDSRYIPEDAMAALVFSTDGWLENPGFEWFPVEVFRVQSQENAGVDVADLKEIRVALSLDPQNMQPRVGAMATIEGPVDLQLLSRALGGSGTEVTLSGVSGFDLNGPPGAILTRVDDKTIYLGMAGYLAEMKQAQDGIGDVSELIASMPQQQGLSLAVAMDQIRPMASGLAMQQSSRLAPDLQPLGRIPELTDAIKLALEFDGQNAKVQFSLIGLGDAEAQQIESIWTNSLRAFRQLGIAELSRSMRQGNQSPAMVDAIDHYANRLADRIISELTSNRDGNHVTIAVESNAGVASTGVLVGLLLPAIQSARSAARRMSSSNNMKQIMLAMHNHHSAYRELPLTAIVDDDGKPLLSWRVKLLPFVEEQALYEQFHLDEPWDSEHNLPLSKQLPAVYASPGKNLGEGKTTYHIVSGEGLAFTPLEKNRFRDFLDGLSNTIMLVEANDDQAVIWSKPGDIEIDLDNPLQGLGSARPGGFHVALSDGAVVFISENIEVGLFKALLTRAGGEVIQEQLNR